MPADFS
jgi:platelet-activating factor acetylhydrolase IB subunit alpha